MISYIEVSKPPSKRSHFCICELHGGDLASIVEQLYNKFSWLSPRPVKVLFNYKECKFISAMFYVEVNKQEKTLLELSR